MSNWYAVQVTTGKEEETACMCRRVIDSEILQECFTPKGERMRRYEGAWHKEKKILFPGYLLLDRYDEDSFILNWKKIPELTKILGDGTTFVSLEQDEVSLLKQMGGEEHIAYMSSGYIEGDRIYHNRRPFKEFGRNHTET